MFEHHIPEKEFFTTIISKHFIASLFSIYLIPNSL